MARSRNIKPSFFTNDVLAECSPHARLLFIGLWTVADREGRLEDRPKKIKAEVMPYDNQDCDILLKELSTRGFLIRYSINGNNYIQIVNFSKHQNPHMKENASTIPASDMPGASHNLNRNEPGLNPLIDSLNPLPLTLKREPVKKRGEESDGFLEFWKTFPKARAGSKQLAERAYRKALGRADEAEILTGVVSYVASDEVARGYAKGAAAWLNDDRWTTDYSTQPKAKANGKSIGEQAKVILESIGDGDAFENPFGRLRGPESIR